MTDAGDGWRDGWDEGYTEGRDDIARELEVENARYRGALEKIARGESGLWGQIADGALRRRSHVR